MRKPLKITFSVALALVSAILVFSCGPKDVTPTVSDPEKVPTQISYNHKILSSKNGQKSYRFQTPLLERYDLAKEPFMEFRQGIKIETFAEDSSQVVESNLVSDYAHYNETTQIWKASGNVIARNIKGEKWLFTELLFWDQTKKIIYTHEKAKVIDGNSVHYGKGFQADDSFQEWSFNNTRGQIEVQEGDSTATDSTTIASPGSRPGSREDQSGANATPQSSKSRKTPMEKFYEKNNTPSYGSPEYEAQQLEQQQGRPRNAASQRMEEGTKKRREEEAQRRKEEDLKNEKLKKMRR